MHHFSTVPPLTPVTFAGSARPGECIRIEAEDAGLANLFIPINNGFVRPVKKLVGGKYPRAKAEEGGVTYGFGFHCHDDSYGCFTPVMRHEVSGAWLLLEFFTPEPIAYIEVQCRAGGNDDDACGAIGTGWEIHYLRDLAGGQTHCVRVPLACFDPNIGIRLLMSSSDVIYVRQARVIPYYETVADASGEWLRQITSPFPYGHTEKVFHYRVTHGDDEIRHSILVQRALERPSGPLQAAAQWVLNRYAKPALGSVRGGFPLAYYDSFAKSMYAGGHVFWMRPYMVMSLIELAARQRVPDELLRGVVDYVCNTGFLETFFPENRRGYLEYCGNGNYYYGAVAMLWHVTRDERLQNDLLRFVEKYLHSQKVHTAMRSYPAQCHNYRGDHLLPTITTNGHEETMHAAVVEAYRITGSRELFHEAVGERGAGFLEHPAHGAVRVPDRLAHAPNARDIYGYYVSLHTYWARSRDAIHYRAEGLIRLYEVTGEERWISLASRRASNFLRYISEKIGNEFLDVNFEYPQSRTSQFQSDASLATSTGGSDGEYFQDIYTAAGLLQHYPIDFYLREKFRRSFMLVVSVIRMETDDPESLGEAWIPHYAWNEDYEDRSAGSRLMSPWIAAGTLLRGESAGFVTDGRASYRGPLHGLRKLIDSSSTPEAMRLSDVGGWFDLPDGTHHVSSLVLRNTGTATISIEQVSVSDIAVAGPFTMAPGEERDMDIRDAGRPGRQNAYRVQLAPDSPATLTLHHRFSSSKSRLFAAGVNEFFGGNLIRRNIVFHNPYAPIAEKSFHDFSDPGSYFRSLPPDEGYNSVAECSYLRTWKPFLELGCDMAVESVMNAEGALSLLFLGSDAVSIIVIYDALWTAADGRVLNGSHLTGGEAAFAQPTVRPVIEARKTGIEDILHPECSLPSAVYLRDGALHADIVNYVGAPDFSARIHVQEALWLGVPKVSAHTGISLNGELVYQDSILKKPNGFEITDAVEDGEYIRLKLQYTGYLRISLSSRAEIPGAPVGAVAAWIDSTGVSGHATRLWWQPSLDKAGHYNVYRSVDRGADFAFVGWSPEPVFTDFSVAKPGELFYRVAAVSQEGIEGEPSTPIRLAALHATSLA